MYAWTEVGGLIKAYGFVWGEREGSLLMCMLFRTHVIIFDKEITQRGDYMILLHART